MVPALLAPAAALAIAAASTPLAARPHEIDRVVAVIRSPASTEARVITLTRLEDETRIALVSRGGVLAATERLDDAALAAGLDWIVDETLLIDDANRLQVFEGDPTDAGEELSRFRSRFTRPSEYQAFLGRWNLSEDDVSAVLRRMARVRRYVDSRVSHAAQVSENEVTAWIEAHAAEAGTRDRELVRARLTQDRIAAEVKTLVRDLRSRAEVRLLARPAAPPGRE